MNVGVRFGKAAARGIAALTPPCVVAMFPLVLLVRAHITEYPFSVAVLVRPATMLAALAVIVFLLMRCVPVTRHCASLATTLFFVVVGLFPLLFPPWSETNWPVAAGFTMASLAIAVAATKVLDGVVASALSWALAVVVLWAMGATYLQGIAWPVPHWAEAVDRITARAQAVHLAETREKPDIYYIIIDAMARADVLEELYGVDASEAIAELEALGFKVPRLSRANYSQTALSIASSMNIQYLSELARVMGNDSDRRPLHRLVSTGGIVRSLKGLGYEFIVVGSSVSSITQHVEIDRCMCELPPVPTELEHGLLVRTPLRGRYGDRAAMAAHRQRVLRSFDQIESTRSRGPMFLVAYIMTPHPPFVFDADGGAVLDRRRYSTLDGDGFSGTREEYLAEYSAQARFVLQRVTTLARRLVAESPRAVIIVHSDHGSGLGLVNTNASRTDPRERLAIFSAYYAGGRDASVPEDISPVNALRWAVRVGLNAHLPLLPNRSHLSDYPRPYRWVEMPP